jgi:hypothetical protein
MSLLKQQGHSKETEAMYYKKVRYEEAWSLMRSIILHLWRGMMLKLSYLYLL